MQTRDNNLQTSQTGALTKGSGSAKNAGVNTVGIIALQELSSLLINLPITFKITSF